jgi:hypothetical protein
VGGLGKAKWVSKKLSVTDNRNMSQELKKQTAAKPTVEAAKPLPEHYTEDSVKDYDFSNFVKVTAFQWGLLFSFGKIHPSTPEVLKSKEILLPFDVAAALSQIIQNHLKELEEKGLIQKKDGTEGIK